MRCGHVLRTRLVARRTAHKWTATACCTHTGENMRLLNRLVAWFNPRRSEAASPETPNAASQEGTGNSGPAPSVFPLAQPVSPARPLAPPPAPPKSLETGVAVRSGTNGQGFAFQPSHDRYAFVASTQLPPLKPPARWFDEASQRRRIREGSKKRFDWPALRPR